MPKYPCFLHKVFKKATPLKYRHKPNYAVKEDVL